MAMFNRIVLNIKQRSKATLGAWTYQCESILAQRSRRIQQLFTFYHRVYGPHGLQQLWHSYNRQLLQPPLRGIMLSAVGAVGLSISNVSAGSGFDWSRERLSLNNFDACRRDIVFIETLPRNKLCPKCKEKQMKFCYCLVGNKKCQPTGGRPGQSTIRNCRTPMHLPTGAEAAGRAMVEAADENIWEPYLSKNEFSIWKREERTAMYSYKVYARFDDITAADLLHVQTDIDYRRQWDETALKLEIVEGDPHPANTNSHLIYWEMQWPKLFSNRDYVYCRRFVTDERQKVMMICSRGTQHPDYPKYADKVRVTDYWSFMVIKPFSSFQEPGVHYILTYYDDPGVPIPQNIKSWVTQRQMPEFLQKMYSATKQYSCKRAVEMKQMHNLDKFNFKNNDYTANVARSSWLSRLMLLRQRERRSDGTAAAAGLSDAARDPEREPGRDK